MRFLLVGFVFTICGGSALLLHAADGPEQQPGSATAKSTIEIDADYPGGNIKVVKIDGDTVQLVQDLRDTSGWWFYYNFRVRGAAGRTLKFEWQNKSPMTTLGPAASTDGGRTWSWLGKAAMKGDSFTYQFPAKSEIAADEVRFCLAMPYQLADLERFIERHKANANFRAETHATTPKDRKIHRLHVGRLNGKAKHRVLLTSRHHACEMMATYSLEGILDTVLSDSPEGKWLRENVEFLAVPLMDLDGVEDGDQGKNRKPHDHNRDYEGMSRYASVIANKEYVPRWSDGKLRIALDMHCPSVRGGGSSRGSNEEICFIGGPDPRIWENTIKLSSYLETMQSGPLPYSTKHNLPHGESWNNLSAEKLSMFSRWSAKLPGVMVATTIEIPYSEAGKKPVTAESARALGADLARAMHRYLSEIKE